MNQIRTAVDVVASDLASITDRLAVEFEQLSGHNLVIAGGAGFLGHYLIQAALHWNNTHADVPPVNVTVLDNFIRGVPDWLTALNGNPNLRLIKHDITSPLPAELGDAHYLIHAASIASPIYYRKYPDRDDGRQRQRLAVPARLLPRHSSARASRSKACCSTPAARFTAIQLRITSRRRRPTAATCPAPGRGRVTTNRSATAKRSASTSRGSTACPSRSLGRSTTTVPG